MDDRKELDEIPDAVADAAERTDDGGFVEKCPAMAHGGYSEPTGKGLWRGGPTGGIHRSFPVCDSGRIDGGTGVSIHAGQSHRMAHLVFYPTAAAFEDLL